MGILLGGPKCWKKQRCKGGIDLFFEWWNDERDELGVGEPAIFIARANKFAISGSRGCAAITLPQAYLYADSKTGAPTRRLIQFAMGACKELGLEPSKMNVRAIADAIVDNLPELLRMPPEPSPNKFVSRKARPIAEVTITDGGKVIAESELH